MSIYSDERFEYAEQARAEVAYEEYVDDCAQADEPAVSFAEFIADCHRQAATLPAPPDAADVAEDDIPF